MHQCVGQAFLDRQRTPRGILHFGNRSIALIALRQIEHPLGRIGAAVEENVFNAFTQGCGDILIDGELPRIDDAHIHARLHGMEQEDGMHRLAHGIVAAEREGEVGNTARNMNMRKRGADFLRRVDEGAAIIIVFFDAGGDREDIGIEDDVFGREAHLVDQNVVGPRADFDLALLGVGLPLLVERHHHDGGAIAHYKARIVDERLFAFLQADGIDDRLALANLEPRLDHRPFG